MSAAHGEQVLLSAATAELVCGHLPEGVTLREMGEHRLKGLLNPERLLQLVASDLRADFPPLASLTGHSLPAQRDVFVGRREPLAELAQRLRCRHAAPLVLGLGGTGKTRLARALRLELARRLSRAASGSAICLQARSLDGIVQRALRRGSTCPSAETTRWSQLGARHRRARHVPRDPRQLRAGRALRRGNARPAGSIAPAQARFMVTTREVLGLPGEEVLALAPLTPSEAAALFLRRAEAAKPGFEPSSEDQAAIAPLMKLLEGLPLAIELAAARVRVVPPRTLLVRMSERFKLLSSSGGRLDRQATMRAVFDWSWELLSLAEKAALAQLSVFEGGFTVESVEAVLDLSAYENAPWPLDALQSLVQKSLVRQVSDTRFDLLVSVQEYAAEHLRTAARYAGSGPGALLASETRHGKYFAGLDEKAAVADRCAELDNLVVACRRAAARGDTDTAAQALEGAWAGLALRGPFRVGGELSSVVQAIPGLGGAAVASVHWVAGRALEAVGKYPEAYEQFEASLARAREVGDRRCEGRTLVGLGFLDLDVSRLESARAHLEAALVIARETKELTLETQAHNGLGSLDHVLGRMGEARVHFERSPGVGPESRGQAAGEPRARQLGQSGRRRWKYGQSPLASGSGTCRGTRSGGPEVGRQQTVQPRIAAPVAATVCGCSRSSRGGAGGGPRLGTRPPGVHRAVQSRNGLRQSGPVRRGTGSPRGRAGSRSRTGGSASGRSDSELPRPAARPSGQFR